MMLNVEKAEEYSKKYDTNLFYMGIVRLRKTCTKVIILKPQWETKCQPKVGKHIRKTFPLLKSEAGYTNLVWSDSDLWFELLGKLKLDPMPTTMDEYESLTKYLAKVRGDDNGNSNETRIRKSGCI